MDEAVVRETKLLSAGYVIGLSLIAGLVLTSYLISRQAIRSKESDSSVINLAGRQRMLSQRMSRDLFLAASLQRAGQPALSGEMLRKNLATWRLVHRGLQEGDAKLQLPGRNSLEVQAAFATLAPHFRTIDSILGQVLARSQSPTVLANVTDEEVRQVMTASNQFLSQMDSIVFLYAREARARVAALQQQEAFTLAAALVLLLLEALFIFRPLVGRVRRGRRALCRTNEELSREVKHRAELEEKQQELSRIKDEFIRIASHDLKAPLTTVLAGASTVGEIVRPGKLMTESCHRLIRRIEANGRVMKQIVEDFLDFRALEDGQVKLSLEQAGMACLVEDVVDRLQDYASQLDIRVDTDLSTDLGDCRMVQSRVTQVLTNLLHNAIKFSPPNSRALVKARREGGMLTVEVEDQGPGFQKDELGRLFRHYSRFSATASTGEKSSGFGLAICRRLVSLHGGNIGARNNSGPGATLWFTIPTSGGTAEFQAVMSEHPEKAPDQPSSLS